MSSQGCLRENFDDGTLRARPHDALPVRYSAGACSGVTVRRRSVVKLQQRTARVAPNAMASLRSGNASCGISLTQLEICCAHSNKILQEPCMLILE